MSKFYLLSLFLVGATTLSAGVCTSTDCTYNLDSTQVPGFGTGPYGTVELQLISGKIKFTIDLADGFGFNLIDTGTHEAFSFNNTLGNPTMTMSNFSSTLYSAVSGSPGSNPPFSNFANGVQSTTCTNGGGCGVNKLTFTVATSSGFTDVNQLVKLSTGGGTAAYFAADIGNTAGNTGPVGATTVAATPEPGSYTALVGAGLGLLAFVGHRRRKGSATV
jgi:hypothetical protein